VFLLFLQSLSGSARQGLRPSLPEQRAPVRNGSVFVANLNRITMPAPISGFCSWLFPGPAALSSTKQSADRLGWVDVAKGLCIVLVVMLHSAKNIWEPGGPQGYLQYFITFAKTFRMPDFFLISGLFLSRVIHKNWRSYLDRKVFHFAYFYFIWATINFLLKAPGILAAEGSKAAAGHYLLSFVQPVGTLWFIYLLPVFFVLTKLLRRVHPVLVFAVAAVLQAATIETGWIVIDQTAERFVFFYAGYLFAPKVFALAAAVQAHTRVAALALIGWALVNGLMVFNGYADNGLWGLLLGFAGAAAVVSFCALIVNTRAAQPLRYCGQQSIVIYLAFFVGMHASRIFLMKTGIIQQVDLVILLVTTAGVLAPLLIWRVIRGTVFRFLFVRPERYRVERATPSVEGAGPAVTPASA